MSVQMTVVPAEILKVYLPGCLCLFSLVALIKFLDKVWRRPIHVQSILRSQGVKGPSYKILHGNVKEIHIMRDKMLSSPMELSHQIYPRILPHVYLWTKLHGKNYVSWKGSKPELVVTEPELVREILNNKDGKYPKPHVQSFLKKIFGDGIIVTKGEKWFKMRKLANHAFHGESLKTMIPQMIASTETMLKRWEKHEHKEIEVFKEFKVFTSETISRTAFGSSYLEGQQIFDVLTRMTLIFSRNHHRTIKLFRTKDDDESDKLEKRLRKCIIELVKKREEEAKRGEPRFYGHDFLGQLMTLYRETDKAKRITLDDLIDECKNFYIAGQDTTSSALTWTVFLLAINLDWQEKVRNEVLEQFGQQIPSAEGIARLKIMNMTINESLRLYPPIAGSPREVQKGARLGDIILPSKMEVFVPTLPLHTNPQIWGDDVHVFRPERFEGGVAKATNNNTTAFLPFSLGPRSCVGMNFAITELKIALTMILQRYRFSLSPSYVHSPVIHIAMCPQHGLQIMLRPLSSNTCSTST